MPNGPCERCGERPHSWFFDGGYLCAVCMDQWWAIQRFLLDNIIR